MCNKLRKDFFFFIYFTMFYFSLFLEDVAIENFNASIISVLKASTIAIMLIMALLHTWKFKSFIRFIASLGIGLGILYTSGDFFWLISMILGFLSINVNEKIIFKISFYIMLFLCGATCLCCLLGILPNNCSFRTDISLIARYSMGFIHSSCLPLGIFYLFSYYVSLKKNKVKLKVIGFFVCVAIIVYKFCDSRNALFATLLLAGGVVVLKKTGNKLINISQTFAKNIAVFMTIFSVLPGILRARGIGMSLWEIYDKVFTNRSLLASAAINSYGINVVNYMKYSEYASTQVVVNSHVRYGIVLDSAYMYLLIRYGVLVLILMLFIINGIYQERKLSVIDNYTLIILLLVNMTDNDFLSYGFLPFMIIGIRNLWERETG